MWSVPHSSGASSAPKSLLLTFYMVRCRIPHAFAFPSSHPCPHPHSTYLIVIAYCYCYHGHLPKDPRTQTLRSTVVIGHVPGLRASLDVMASHGLRLLKTYSVSETGLGTLRTLAPFICPIPVEWVPLFPRYRAENEGLERFKVVRLGRLTPSISCPQ